MSTWPRRGALLVAALVAMSVLAACVPLSHIITAAASGSYGASYLSNGNHPPVANAGPDAFAHSGAGVILDGSQSVDADGQPLTYHWFQTAGPTLGVLGPDSATAAIQMPAASVTFRLTVRDSAGLSDTDTVTINVN